MFTGMNNTLFLVIVLTFLCGTCHCRGKIHTRERVHVSIPILWQNFASFNWINIGEELHIFHHIFQIRFCLPKTEFISWNRIKIEFNSTVSHNMNHIPPRGMWAQHDFISATNFTPLPNWHWHLKPHLWLFSVFGRTGNPRHLRLRSNSNWNSPNRTHSKMTEEDKVNGADEDVEEDKKSKKVAKHNDGGADLERVTDYAEERELSSADISKVCTANSCYPPPIYLFVILTNCINIFGL